MLRNDFSPPQDQLPYHCSPPRIGKTTPTTRGCTNTSTRSSTGARRANRGEREREGWTESDLCMLHSVCVCIKPLRILDKTTLLLKYEARRPAVGRIWRPERAAAVTEVLNKIQCSKRRGNFPFSFFWRPMQGKTSVCAPLLPSPTLSGSVHAATHAARARARNARSQRLATLHEEGRPRGGGLLVLSQSRKNYVVGRRTGHRSLNRPLCLVCM